MSKAHQPAAIPKPGDPVSSSKHSATKSHAFKIPKVRSKEGVALRAVAAALLFSRRGKGQP